MTDLPEGFSPDNNPMDVTCVKSGDSRHKIRVCYTVDYPLDDGGFMYGNTEIVDVSFDCDSDAMAIARVVREVRDNIADGPPDVDQSDLRVRIHSLTVVERPASLM